MKNVLVKITAIVIVLVTFSSCATIFAGGTGCINKPSAGEPQRQVRPVPLILDIACGLVWVGVDFATGDIYKPCSNLPKDNIGKTDSTKNNKTNDSQASSANMETREFKKIAKLHELCNDSILTKEEFESEKNKILDPFHKNGGPSRLTYFDKYIYTKLQELKALQNKGAISKSDFDTKKREILGKDFFEFYIKK